MASRTKATSTTPATSEFKPEIELQAFDDRCKAYFKFISEQKKCFPDLYGMISYLNMDEETYKKYEKLPGYDAVCQRCVMQRKSWLMRKIAGDKSASTGIQFLLSLPENGAVVKGEGDSNLKEIELKLVGMEDVIKK